MKLDSQHQLIVVDGASWDLGRVVLAAHRIGDRVVVVFDYMSYPKSQQARNLVAYDLSQKPLWVAEHPTTDVTDTYIRLLDEAPLRVLNFASYTCEIDVCTGKLKETIFTK